MTESSSLTVGEATDPQSVSLGWNQYVSRAIPCLAGLWESLFLDSSSFWGLWHSLSCGHITHPLSLGSQHLLCVRVSNLPLPPIRTLAGAFRAHLDNPG